MKALDRYIVAKIFTVLPVFIVALICLICLITYIIDIFVLGNSALENVGFFAAMYFYFINTVATFNIIIPILSFISIALITLRLSDRNEIIATLSLGVSYRRLFKPFFISSVFLLKVMLIFEGWVIPGVNKIREELDYKYFGVGSRSYGTNIHLKLKNNRYMYIEYFSKYSNVGENVFIDTIINGRLISRFKAKKIKWNDSRNMWVFINWEKREFGELKDIINTGKEIELSNIEILPSDLVFDESFQTKLNVYELNAFTDRLEKHGLNSKLFRIEQTKRATRPIMLFLAAIVGFLFFSKKRREGNTLLNFFGFILSAFIIVTSIVAEDLAIYSNVNMYILFFLPLLIFGLINYFVYKKYR